MWRYALLFVAVHIAATVMNVLVVSALHLHPSSALGFAMQLLAAMVVASVFVRRRKRHFTIQERRALIAECLPYLVLVELVGLFGDTELASKFPGGFWAGLAIAGAFDWLILWVAFRYVVHPTMQKYLDKIANVSPS